MLQGGTCLQCRVLVGGNLQDVVVRRKAKLGLAVFGQCEGTGQCDMFILEAVWLQHNDRCFAGV